MANQIIEQQAEAQAAKQECRPMQFIVADEWDAAGQCCAAPAQAEDIDQPPAASDEQDWGWGCCVA